MSSEHSSEERRCPSWGSTGERCQRERGHEGAHFALIGAGSSGWPGAGFPRWAHGRGWLRPGDEGYDPHPQETCS